MRRRCSNQLWMAANKSDGNPGIESRLHGFKLNDRTTTGGKMKPELKLGRRCIAWEDNVDPVKGNYIKFQPDDGHWVLGDDGSIMPYQRVEIDLDADPMNGDEVEVSDHNDDWSEYTDYYIGKALYGKHITLNIGSGAVAVWNHVRFPQQSKRERLIEYLGKIPILARPEEFADKTLKITEEE